MASVQRPSFANRTPSKASAKAEKNGRRWRSARVRSSASSLAGGRQVAPELAELAGAVQRHRERGRVAQRARRCQRPRAAPAGLVREAEEEQQPSEVGEDRHLDVVLELPQTFAVASRIEQLERAFLVEPRPR